MKLEGLLETRSLARVLEAHETIDSTNDRAKALAASGALHGTCVVARAQTVGRGRLGRTWWSPPGAGLYASFVLRPELAAREAPLLTLLSAVALCDAIGPGVGIKWPNDIHGGTPRRKVAGILTEASTSGAALAFAVVGIGVNVREVARPPEIAALATSVEAVTGRAVEAEALLAALANALESRLDVLERGGRDAILSAWRARALGIGAVVELADGASRVRGTLEGVAADGAVLIDGRAYYSGILTLP